MRFTIRAKSFSFDEGTPGWVARHRQPLNVPDVFEDPRTPAPRWWQAHGLTSLYAVPVVHGSELLAVLALNGTKPFALPPDDEDLLESFIAQASVAIRNARLHTEARESAGRLRVLSRQLIEAQETERRRLAYELHDEFGQVTTALKLSLQTLGRSGQAPSPLDDSMAMVDRLLQQVRELSLDLRPSLLDDFGLGTAVRWLVRRQAERAELVATVGGDVEGERFPPDVEIAAFRTVQEAVTNVARHARAPHLTVELHRRAGALEVVVRDDGAGFDVAAVRERARHGASLGLLGLEERVRLAGGSIEIESARGRGTEIRAMFPAGRGESA